MSFCRRLKKFCQLFLPFLETLIQKSIIYLNKQLKSFGWHYFVLKSDNYWVCIEVRFPAKVSQIYSWNNDRNHKFIGENGRWEALNTNYKTVNIAEWICGEKDYFL